MNELTIEDRQKFIFGSIFFLSNKLQALGDQYLLSRDMTTRQWLLIVAISQFGNESPTLSEVAVMLSSTHQNIKQIALKLEKKGFLNIEKDKKDKRALRLKLTQKSNVFWEESQQEDTLFIKDLFKHLSEEEINGMCSGIDKLMTRIFKMGESYRKE
ncbi:DNA-binding MarR family transcriptional regulator [Natranaerovirga pectinivora]|uniref:DNA-binding MarR family transcriptional regulator n=1 Tax=Natranaerovirga pectinivora TaxID=682400 RepID=A0A4R3MP59_9FIRM|nr:MarR family transcriptional regulator [Natranaerovirga pectinivora]TCT15379.1 DNA-binding MarR family transcriptional regulator [Natranaerovirga pectinivora]